MANYLVRVHTDLEEEIDGVRAGLVLLGGVDLQGLRDLFDKVPGRQGLEVSWYTWTFLLLPWSDGVDEYLKVLDDASYVRVVGAVPGENDGYCNLVAVSTVGDRMHLSNEGVYFSAVADDSGTSYWSETLPWGLLLNEERENGN